MQPSNGYQWWSCQPVFVAGGEGLVTDGAPPVGGTLLGALVQQLQRADQLRDRLRARLLPRGCRHKPACQSMPPEMQLHGACWIGVFADCGTQAALVNAAPSETLHMVFEPPPVYG